MIKPIVLRQRGHIAGGGSVLARTLEIPSAHAETVRSTRRVRYVINWGSSIAPANWRQRALIYSTTPESVARSANKIVTFARLRQHNVPTLESSTIAAQARAWVESDGKCVARHVLNGHSGAGIEILRDANAIPPAPLYTRYWKKHHEFRVHVAFGNVILIQQKRLRNGQRDVLDRDHMLVRTHDNGYVFSVNDLSCDRFNYRQRLVELTTLAANALELNHGAIDILVRTNRGAFVDAVVCETNSAPALEGASTVAAYTRAFQTEIARISSTI